MSLIDKVKELLKPKDKEKDVEEWVPSPAPLPPMPTPIPTPVVPAPIAPGEPGSKDVCIEGSIDMSTVDTLMDKLHGRG